MNNSFLEKRYNSFFIGFSVLSFLILAIRNATVPLAHDEISTFFTYVQIGEFLPYRSYLDANNHIFNSFLTWISFKFFGASPFALRLPNLLFFPVLVIATYKINSFFQSYKAKLFLTVAFLFSFNWLSFYSLCRGYGMSMSLFVLALYFFIKCCESDFRFKYFLLFVLSVQLGISANLTLQIASLLFTFILIFYQITNQKIKNWKIISVYFFHFLMLKYWIDYSFYLKQNGALYYGSGESYWKITFETLIGLITGFEHFWLNLLIACSFAAVFVIYIFLTLKNNTKFIISFKKAHPFLIITLSTFILIVGFYLMKIFAAVNYPEDRAALFFYPLFILSLVYLIDYLKLENTALLLSFIFIAHFAFSLNFKKHVIMEYESLPDEFYFILKKEQELSESKITIGNHRQTKQLFLAYKNYLENGDLNYSDVQNNIHNFCDFYLGASDEEKTLSKDYVKIAFDKNWGFGLYKRKTKAQKDLIFESNQAISITQAHEFYDLVKWKDTIFTQAENKALLFEFEFDVKSASKPFEGIFILSIESENHKNECYKGITMNNQKFDWNNQNNNKYSILSPKLESDSTNYSFYFWNKKMQEIDMKILSVKVYIIN